MEAGSLLPFRCTGIGRVAVLHLVSRLIRDPIEDKPNVRAIDVVRGLAGEVDPHVHARNATLVVVAKGVVGGHESDHRMKQSCAGFARPAVPSRAPGPKGSRPGRLPPHRQRPRPGPAVRRRRPRRRARHLPAAAASSPTRSPPNGAARCGDRGAALYGGARRRRRPPDRGLFGVDPGGQIIHVKGNHGSRLRNSWTCGSAQSSMFLVHAHLPWFAARMPGLEDRRHAERWRRMFRRVL